MTSGVKTNDARMYVFVPGQGNIFTGSYSQKDWIGGDAIKVSTPASSYPVVERRPRPSLTQEEKRARNRQIRAARKQGKVYVFPPLEPLPPKRRKWTPEEVAAFKASKRRQRKELLRLLPPQDYSMTYRRNDQPIILTRRTGGATQYVTQLNDPWSESILTPDPSHEYKVIAKLREKVYGSGFNPAVFTAEGKQSLQMIFDAATRLRYGFGHLKKGHWLEAAEALSLDPRKVRDVVNHRKDMSGRVLELNYGWLPIVSDMEEAAKYIGEVAMGNSRYRNRVVARRTWSVPESSPYGQYAKWDQRVTIFELQYVCYSVEKSPVYMPSIATVATVAWEKLPWSFVADWVVPVGSYLEALRTKSDMEGTFVRTLKTHVFYTHYTAGYGEQILGFAIPGQPFVKQKHFMKRTVSTELTVPNPVKGLADDLSFMTWRRAVNAVALLAQKDWSLSGSPFTAVAKAIKGRGRYTE